MFCTGGIRCEKASVYLEKKGFNNIYQLNGGILNYLKKTYKLIIFPQKNGFFPFLILCATIILSIISGLLNELPRSL